jgi:toxin CptA
MHRPPAVTHSVDRSRWHLRLVLSILVLGALVCALLFDTLPGPMERLLCLLVPGVAMCIALSDWLRAAKGLLQWDGLQWLWSGFGDRPVRSLTLILDFQRVMLVKVRAEDGGSAWLWLETADMNRHWLALRRAIVASRVIDLSSIREQGTSSAGVAL